MSNILRLILSLFWFLIVIEAVQLEVRGTDLVYNGVKVFLSGTNIAWNSYGYDFGNSGYNSYGPKLEEWLEMVRQNGGNSIRIWIHVEGDNTPEFDNDGFVVGPDHDGTLISDMKQFLNVARSKNIVVIFVLWNGAVLRNPNAINLVWDDSKLESFIEKSLKPMVESLKGHPALGAWEIVNEFEGSVRAGEANSNPCFDTTILSNSGAGWTGNSIPMERYLRFINLQLSAIKDVDPVTLVTVGSWSEKSQNQAFEGSFNYYNDDCLIAAGGKPNGILDFFQIHTYSFNGLYNPSSPLKQGNSFSSFRLPKPLVIGEFAAESSEQQSIETLVEYAYENGYNGAWCWAYNVEFPGTGVDDRNTINRGLLRLQGRTNPTVNFELV